MPTKEMESPINVTMFRDGAQYDEYLRKNGMGSGYGSRAKGILREDGTIDVAIDQGYYERGGIPKEQLKAIVEHEQIELTTDDPDPHLQASIGEYRYILNHYGQNGLQTYHIRMCNLMGGLNDIRNLALRTVIGK